MALRLVDGVEDGVVQVRRLELDPAPVKPPPLTTVCPCSVATTLRTLALSNEARGLPFHVAVTAAAR